MWLRAVLVASMVLGGCGSAAENGPKAEPMPEKPEPEPEWECTVGQKYDCRHSSPKCAAAKYECLSSAPNSFGPCICEQAALQAVGPTEPVSQIIAGAFGPGGFYWAEYHFVSGAPFAKIAVGPISGAGQVIIDHIAGGQSLALSVTEDTIYAGSQAFTLGGMPLAPPDPMVAFPATTSRVGNSANGFMIDGIRVDAEALDWAEVEDGVYYFTDYGSSFVMFRSFATPGESKLVASAPYPMGGRIGLFRRVWASGAHVYLSTLLGDDKTYVLNYLDMSIVGK